MMAKPILSKSVATKILPAMLAILSVVSVAQAAGPQVRTQAPGFYRMILGDFEITALLDGTHPFPAAAVLTKSVPGAGNPRSKLFDGAADEGNTLLAAADIDAPPEGSINAFLVNTGKKLILIDSGAGTLYGACCGHLIENLKAAGYRPEQIDEIFLTHLHADHVGGIAPNGKMAFPNAVVRVSQQDADYWLNDENEKMAPAFLRSMFEGDRASLKPYIAARRFLPFSGSLELAPGVHAIPAPGHTPGHTFYSVENRGQKLLIWGDVIHVAAIQFPDPSVSVEYDYDEQQAEQTRETVFADAAREGYWIGAAHISFPGLGHVGMRGKEFIWIPADYTTRMSAAGK